MPDTEIRTLGKASSFLIKCPVFMRSDSEFGYDQCNQPLEVVWEHDIIGDDYGSCGIDSLRFACGHTLDEMLDSIRHRSEV